MTEVKQNFDYQLIGRFEEVYKVGVVDAIVFIHMYEIDINGNASGDLHSFQIANGLCLSIPPRNSPIIIRVLNDKIVAIGFPNEQAMRDVSDIVNSIPMITAK